MMDSKHIAKEIRSAIKESDIEKVVYLIDSNSERLNMMTPFGTWLHVAASRGELAIAKKLVELGLDVNKSGGVYGGGALNEAASAGHSDIVKFLLSSSAVMDVSEPEKNPLFGAISNGHIEVAKILIDNGINIDVTYNGSSKKNVDAITFAREQGEEEIAKLLENHKKTSITMEEENNSNQEHHDVILKHVTNSFGSIKNSISEHIPGSRVAINIHIIPPSNNKNFITLVTTGMSDRPMDYSKEDSVYKYAELLLKLPLNWEIEKESMNDEKNLGQ